MKIKGGIECTIKRCENNATNSEIIRIRTSSCKFLFFCDVNIGLLAILIVMLLE